MTEAAARPNTSAKLDQLTDDGIYLSAAICTDMRGSVVCANVSTRIQNFICQTDII